MDSDVPERDTPALLHGAGVKPIHQVCVRATGALSTDPDVYIYPPVAEKVASQLLSLLASWFRRACPSQLTVCLHRRDRIHWAFCKEC